MAPRDRVVKAVIPVAGLGTRFLPVTKALPKEMLPIVDKPSIQYIVEEAVTAGIKDVIFITGKGKHALEDHFDNSSELKRLLAARGQAEQRKELEHIEDMVRVVGVRQKEPRGLGHAVSCADGLVAEDAFAVMLGDDLVQSDDPCIGQLIHAWNEHHKAVVAVERVRRSDVEKYGVVGTGKKIGERLTLVRDMVEKPKPADAPSDLAIIGRYVLPTKIFDILRDLPAGRGGEIQLTDALRILAAEEGVIACEFAGKRFDAGNKVGWIEANLGYALARPELADDVRAVMRRMLGEA